MILQARTVVFALPLFLFILLSLVSPASQGSEKIDNLARTTGSVKTSRGADITVQTESGKTVLLRLEFVEPSVARIRLARGEITDREEFILAGTDWKKVKVKFDKSSAFFTLRSPELKIRVSRSPFRLLFLGRKDEPILGRDGLVFGFGADSVLVQGPLGSGEHILGLGAGAGKGAFPGGMENEMCDRLDKRGETVRIIGRRVPFFISSRGYGLFANTPYVARFDMGSTKPDGFSIIQEGDYLDLFLLQGPGPKKILRLYTWLTGRTPLVPRWAFGLRQAGYWAQDTAINYASKYRELLIPCDLIHIDSSWLNKAARLEDLWMGVGMPVQQGYVDFEPAPQQFPDFPGMIKELKSMGFKLSLWETALVNPNVGEFFETGKAAGYFVTNPKGEIILVPYGKRGPAATPDFSNPRARQWWKEAHKKLIDQGVASFKMDISGNLSGQQDAVFYNGLPWSQMHTFYKILNLQTVYSATAEYTGRRGLI